MASTKSLLLTIPFALNCAHAGTDGVTVSGPTATPEEQRAAATGAAILLFNQEKTPAFAGALKEADGTLVSCFTMPGKVHGGCVYTDKKDGKIRVYAGPTIFDPAP